MRIRIEHSISLSPLPGPGQAVIHLLLTPIGGPTQSVESWSVEAPGIGNAGRFTDAFGNPVHLVNQSRPEGDIALIARGVVTTRDTHGVIGRPGGEPVPALYKRLTPSTRSPAAIHRGLRGSKDGRLDVLHTLMARVGDALGVVGKRREQTQMQADGGQAQSQDTEAKPLAPAMDFAHMFIGAARALDIPARYVTGYLVGDDDHAGGLHAWAEAYDEALGWIGFDPQLQLCATERHVRLCVGLDGESALPLRAVPTGEIVHRASVETAAAKD